MADDALEKLIVQCRSSDVDAKVDAVTKLKDAFEAGVEIKDSDGLLGVLKTCVRSSNLHLSAATLSALPPLFPLFTTGTRDDATAVVDAASLRQLLTALLPAGGIIDRLGDRYERVRDKARESLVILAGLSLRCGVPSLHASTRQRDAGKGPETPIMIWERFFRDTGLSSKSPRVREQSLLTYVEVRRMYSSLPLKPYVPQLIELLEDGDGTVRTTARESVVELFSGPTVTDSARADLKKEMGNRNVRKTTQEHVLQRLLSGGAGPGVNSAGQSEAGSENGDVPNKQYIPPSLKLQGRQPTAPSGHSAMSRSVSTSASLADGLSRPGSRLANEVPATPTTESGEVQLVYIASVKDLENEFTSMLKFFEGKETEHNWADRERSINRIRGMLKGEAHIKYPDTFLTCLKGGMVDKSFKTLLSLRTTVSQNTCHLYSELAIALGPAFDPFCESVLTRLIGMASMTKKIVANLAQQAADTIVIHATPQPRMYLQLLSHPMSDKNVSSRQAAIKHIKVYLDVHGQRLKHAIETSSSVEYLENSLKIGLSDQNPAVRENSRPTFWTFEGFWKERAAAIMAKLDATQRKQLEKACPNPSKAAVPPSTPQTKKSSVAAQIAASRARAKAIATAPPSLRHQATSTSHILNNQATSPPQRGGSRPSSPLASNRGGYTTIRRSPSAGRPMSPGSPTSRRVASYSPSSMTTMAAPPAALHQRSFSGEGPPSSPSLSHRRVASYQSPPPSPGSTGGSIDVAVKTALPPSPRNSLDIAIKTTLPPSPPRQFRATRLPSPTRIPSPTRRPEVRKSLTAAVNLVQREKFSLASQYGGDESLLLAQTIPLPDGSESDDDDSHMMSFSAPYEKYHLSMPKTNESSLSAGSPPPNAPEPIVEDALRATAEQAESAAERLLELVEPEDESTTSPIPRALLRSNGSTTVKTSKTTARSTVLQSRTINVPSTPVNKKSSILQQAALFKDSPVNKGTTLLLDVLRERKHESGWWLKRMSIIDKGSPFKGVDEKTKVSELKRFTTALSDESADITVLKKLALLCMDNPVHEDLSELSTAFSFPITPSPLNLQFNKGALKTTIWDEEKLFDRMFNALMQYLTFQKSEDLLEYGLIVLWEILDNQASLVEGREADVFDHLLQIRYCNKINVLEATNTIRDALVSRIEPVYGLTTLHASLRSFYSDPLPPDGTQEAKASSYAFGLIALGKFILRLPAEILEDELPRLKGTLTTALSDSTSLVVRESAATCIIAAQVVLRDETHLFTLLDGLSDEKKNLLTYLFDKHSARGNKGKGGNSTEKLEKEMKRLDGRTNTPPRVK